MISEESWKLEYMFDSWSQKFKYSLRTLLNGVIFINSTIILSCGLHVNIFYVKYVIQVSTT